MFQARILCRKFSLTKSKLKQLTVDIRNEFISLKIF